LSTSVITLNLDTIELETTLRPFGANGAPDSLDYNDQMAEILTDLATITECINDVIRPILNALPAQAALPATNPKGIEGRTIFSDTSNQTALFYDSVAKTPLTIAQTISLLSGMIQGVTISVTNLGLQVTSLNSQLSVSNQNDTARALQAVTTALNAITARVTVLESK